MISTALLSLAVSCFCGSVLASSFAGVSPSAWQPPSSPSYSGSRFVQIVPDYCIPYDNAEVELLSLSGMDDEDLDAFDFEWGYEYFPYSCTVEIDPNTNRIGFTQMLWYKVYVQGFTNFGNSCLPNGYYSFVMASYEGASFNFFGPALTFDWYGSGLGADQYGTDVNGKLKYYFYDNDPRADYRLYDSYSNVQVLSEVAGKAYLDSYNIYESGYQEGQRVGYDSGKADGLREGKAEGYQQAIDENGALEPNGVIYGLFGALVNVPISIFNGLTPLVIWNTPIITIILTFFAIGVVLWVIKKVI